MPVRDKIRFERMLAMHTAPALMGIKCANLISAANTEKDISEYRKKFEAQTGLHIKVLCRCRERQLLYIYHTGLLEMQLCLPETREFLKMFGYSADMTAEEMLEILSARFTEEEFPHEIGVFLGYPLADVIGFIKNHGENCLMCGCWKVYSDPENARRTFENYGRCRDILCDKLNQGFDLFKALELSKEELS